MKLYNTQKLNEVMENIKPKTILFFHVEGFNVDVYDNKMSSTEIDFVKAIVTIDAFTKMGESVLKMAKERFGNFKTVVHCNRFKLIQSAETNEWDIYYNDSKTDYKFLYAFEKADDETYKLLGTVEDFQEVCYGRNKKY